MEVEDSFRLSSYIHKSNGYVAASNFEENAGDHSYGRSGYWRQDFVFSKPARTLFVHPPDDLDNRAADEVVDVEAVTVPLPPVYDVAKATSLMQECEEHVACQHSGQENPDWEDQIPRLNWTNMQTRLLNRVVRVLHNDQLARLAHNSRDNEPVLRRLTVDKTARRLRQVLASVAWNTKYTQWLHNILMDNLPSAYLVGYLDAVQMLKCKVPTLVERMLAGSSTRSSLATPHHELLSIVHKRPWDPISTGLTLYKPKKLPKEPILVMVPSGPGAGNVYNSRTHHWMANLSALGTVVCVYSSPGRVVGKVSMSTCMDHMLASTRAKVQELHTDYGDKPIVLVGIGSGAALACQVALVESVTAVVCLGFPLYTAEDNRGTPDDAILNMQVPMLFVVGQNASTCSVEEMEDLRDRLNVVSQLVVVGGGDDQLRLSKAKKKLEGVTQSLVDKCVMDEVADFLGTLLSPDYKAPVRPPVGHPIDPVPKRPIIKPVERKRKNEVLITHNPDTLPLVPAKKGRKPKISMMQKIVQNKWASQCATNDLSRTTTTPTTQTTVVLPPKHVVVDQKNLQFSIQGGKIQAAARPAPASVTSEGTITVVAASNPALPPTTPDHQVKGRLASGQLTSLTSILPPGTRGVLSPGSRTVKTEDKNILAASSAPIIDEMNIMDMPVILGDQNPDELLSQQLASAAAPVKFILTNTKPTIKVVKGGQQPVKCTKIFISKAKGSERPVNTPRPKPRIRHIPATKHSQFY